MALWGKRKADPEDPRTAPIPQVKESSLTEVETPKEDYEVIENEDDDPKDAPESYYNQDKELPELPKELKQNLNDEDALLEKLEKTKSEILKMKEERLKKEQEEAIQNQLEQPLPEHEFTNRGNIVYLSDAECLREILGRLDFLSDKIDVLLNNGRK